MTKCTVDPTAVPKVHLDALSRIALRGARQAFEDPAFRAEFEEWLALRREATA